MQPAAGQHVRELDISRVCPHKLHYRVACDLRSEHGVQLLEVFRAFTALHPDVELSLTVRAGENVTAGQAVLEGDADLALITSWDPRPPQISYLCDDWNGRLGLVAAGVGVMLRPVRRGAGRRTKGHPPAAPLPQAPATANLRPVLQPPDRSAAINAMLEVMRRHEPGNHG